MVSENALEFSRAQRAARRILECRSLAAEVGGYSSAGQEMALRGAAEYENIVIDYANVALNDAHRAMAMAN